MAGDILAQIDHALEDNVFPDAMRWHPDPENAADLPAPPDWDHEAERALRPAHPDEGWSFTLGPGDTAEITWSYAEDYLAHYPQRVVLGMDAAVGSSVVVIIGVDTSGFLAAIDRVNSQFAAMSEAIAEAWARAVPGPWRAVTEPRGSRRTWGWVDEIHSWSRPELYPHRPRVADIPQEPGHHATLNGRIYARYGSAYPEQLSKLRLPPPAATAGPAAEQRLDRRRRLR